MENRDLGQRITISSSSFLVIEAVRRVIELLLNGFISLEETPVNKLLTRVELVNITFASKTGKTKKLYKFECQVKTPKHEVLGGIGWLTMKRTPSEWVLSDKGENYLSFHDEFYKIEFCYCENFFLVTRIQKCLPPKKFSFNPL